MLTLAFESSARPASVALMEDDVLVSQYTQCSALTHSRTLLPMAEDLLKNAEISIKDIDRLAVAQGPGSFTGIRIGISTVKGLEGSLRHWAIWFGGTKSGSTVTPSGSAGKFIFDGYLHAFVLGKGVNEVQEMQIDIIPTTEISLTA